MSHPIDPVSSGPESGADGAGGAVPEAATETATATAVIDNGRFGTRTIRFETGRLARQAAGSVVAYLDDDTMLLSATTASKHPKEHFDFFPLTIDVEERMYAAGRIPARSSAARAARPRTRSSPAG